jgi:hypothetical protein
MEMVEGGTRAKWHRVLSEKLLAELSDLVRDAGSTFSASPFIHGSTWQSAAPVWRRLAGWSRAPGSSSVSTVRCGTPVSPKEDVGLIIMMSNISKMTRSRTAQNGVLILARIVQQAGEVTFSV